MNFQFSFNRDILIDEDDALAIALDMVVFQFSFNRDILIVNAWENVPKVERKINFQFSFNRDILIVWNGW